MPIGKESMKYIRNYEVTDSLTDRDFATLLDGEKLYM